jgi:hypothetical protein
MRKHRTAAFAVAIVTALATASPAAASGGNGASPCSQSGRVELGGQTIIDTFGHAVVAPTVHGGDHFDGSSNPGQGFDWAYGQAGDGPVVPDVCRPER